MNFKGLKAIVSVHTMQIGVGRGRGGTGLECDPNVCLCPSLLIRGHSWPAAKSPPADPTQDPFCVPSSYSTAPLPTPIPTFLISPLFSLFSKCSSRRPFSRHSRPPGFLPGLSLCYQLLLLSRAFLCLRSSDPWADYTAPSRHRLARPARSRNDFYQIVRNVRYWPHLLWTNKLQTFVGPDIYPRF